VCPQMENCSYLNKFAPLDTTEAQLNIEKNQLKLNKISTQNEIEESKVEIEAREIKK
jgi:hypothetical protein